MLRILPVIAALCLLGSAIFAVSALAETPEQFAVAKARVVKATTYYQYKAKYRRADGTRVTPRADWKLWGTTAEGNPVTLTYRIRVEKRSGRWGTCTGRVVVRDLKATLERGKRGCA